MTGPSFWSIVVLVSVAITRDTAGHILFSNAHKCVARNWTTDPHTTILATNTHRAATQHRAAREAVFLSGSAHQARETTQDAATENTFVFWTNHSARASEATASRERAIGMISDQCPAPQKATHGRGVAIGHTRLFQLIRAEPRRRSDARIVAHRSMICGIPYSICFSPLRRKGSLAEPAERDTGLHIFEWPAPEILHCAAPTKNVLHL